MYNNGNSSNNVTGASVVDGTMESADYADNGLSGDKIDGGIISNFQSTGIDDRASSAKALTFDANKRAMFGGTTTPACYNGSGGSKPFVVQSSDATTTVPNAENLLCVVNSDDTTNNMSGIGFGWTDTDENPHYLSASINAIMGSAVTGQYRSADLAVLTSSATNSAPSEKVRFLAGGGITFNGDTAAANALDDYEEGNWTGSLTSLTPPTAIPTATGTYVKIGRQVTVNINLNNKDTSGGSGKMYITGLPFAAAAGHIGSYASHSLEAQGSFGSAFAVNSIIEFFETNDASGWADVQMVAGTGKYLYVTVTYQV